jgi:hypothetical protein
MGPLPYVGSVRWSANAAKRLPYRVLDSPVRIQAGLPATRTPFKVKPFPVSLMFHWDRVTSIDCWSFGRVHDFSTARPFGSLKVSRFSLLISFRHRAAPLPKPDVIDSDGRRMRGRQPFFALSFAASSPFSGLTLAPWRPSPGCRAVVGSGPSRLS